MTDLSSQLQTALAKAAEYELIGNLAVDKEKREECRVKAAFYHNVAHELRKLMAQDDGKGGGPILPSK